MYSNWYFAKSGSSNGPVSLDDLRRDLQSGVLGPETLVWNASMPNWQAVSTIAELWVSPPPLPPSQAAGAPDIAPVSLTEPRRGTSAPWSPHGPQTISAPQSHSQIGPDGLYIGAPSRGFVEAISICFTKYDTFSGRASRSEYWFFALFCFIIGMIPFIGLVTILPSIAVTVRRLHDTGRSGWWWGGPALTLVGLVLIIVVFGERNHRPEALEPLSLGFLGCAIALLVFMCLKGTPGPNRFG